MSSQIDVLISDETWCFSTINGVTTHLHTMLMNPWVFFSKVNYAPLDKSRKPSIVFISVS